MFAILAAVFMFCEVLMDLLQLEIMSRIVDQKECQSTESKTE